MNLTKNISLKFVYISLLLLIFSCSEIFQSNTDYNFVEITQIIVHNFVDTNQNGGPWDELSSPDIFATVKEGTENFVNTETFLEIQEYEIPFSLVFPESFVTPYFYRDIVIYLYEEDIFDDDFIGKSDTFRFADAIEDNNYSSKILLENEIMDLEISLKWSY